MDASVPFLFLTVQGRYFDIEMASFFMSLF